MGVNNEDNQLFPVVGEIQLILKEPEAKDMAEHKKKDEQLIIEKMKEKLQDKSKVEEIDD